MCEIGVLILVISESKEASTDLWITVMYLRAVLSSYEANHLCQLSRPLLGLSILIFTLLWSEQSQNPSNQWQFWSKLYLNCLFLSSAWDPWEFWFNWFGYLPPRANCLNITSTVQVTQTAAQRSQHLGKRYTCVQKRETIHECWGQGRG